MDDPPASELSLFLLLTAIFAWDSSSTEHQTFLTGSNIQALFSRQDWAKQEWALKAAASPPRRSSALAGITVCTDEGAATVYCHLFLWDPLIEPNILECEVKWALESITTNKASDSSWAISNLERWCCESATLSMSANLENSAVASRLEKVNFLSI